MSGDTSFSLFDKLYSCYYLAVRRILEEAALSPVDSRRMEEICRACAFDESALSIVPELTRPDGAWSALLSAKRGGLFSSSLGSASLKPPLSRLQKAWLKAICSDPRFLLFFSEEERDRLSAALEEDGQVTELYKQEEFYYYDQFQDGDDYESVLYRRHFATILEGILNRQMLRLSYKGKRQLLDPMKVFPVSLQYSAKDDKFRLLCIRRRSGRPGLGYTLNVSKILSCELCRETPPAGGIQAASAPPFSAASGSGSPFVRKAEEPAVIEIDGRRNSLERCMLKFADYEKRTEYDEKRGVYICSICYDIQDETELIIDLLSFGPVIRVVSPERIVRQIRERVMRQHEWLFGAVE